MAAGESRSRIHQQGRTRYRGQGHDQQIDPGGNQHADITPASQNPVARVVLPRNQRSRSIKLTLMLFLPGVDVCTAIIRSQRAPQAERRPRFHHRNQRQQQQPYKAAGR